jgi:antitoxin component of MazEF toxin-antitoxin module
MIKTLTPIGNSLAIILDRAVLDALGITRETLLEVTARDGGLFIRPLDAADHEVRVRASAARMARVHRESLRKLAE